MKKITLLLLCLGVFTQAVKAQETNYKIGFKVNPNVSWMHPNDNNLISEGSKLRFGFSLNFDKMFTDNYAIGTGLNVFTTGGELTYFTRFNSPDTMTQVATVTRNYRLQYVEVPLTLKLRTNEVGYWTFWGQFGLGLGANISAKADEKVNYLQEIDNDALGTDNPSWAVLPGNDKRNVENEDVNIKDDVSLFRASLIMGAGGEYNLSGSTSLLFGLTFNNGFTDALKRQGVRRVSGTAGGFQTDRQGPVLFDLSSRTNFVEFNIGLLF
jgi:hypothetical protein